MHGLLDYLGACHTRLQESCLGAYPGVGAFHSCDKNQHLGAYPGEGACPGEYGNKEFTKVTDIHVHNALIEAVNH